MRGIAIDLHLTRLAISIAKYTIIITITTSGIALIIIIIIIITFTRRVLEKTSLLK